MDWYILAAIAVALAISAIVRARLAKRRTPPERTGPKLRFTPQESSASNDEEPDIPQDNDSADAIEGLLNMLYCDVSAEAWQEYVNSEAGEESDRPQTPAAHLAKARESGESRAILGAWHQLRAEGKTPPPDEANQILGVVLETNQEDLTTITAGFADGDARLYSLDGLGVIGEMSQVPTIATAAQDCVAEATRVIEHFSPAPDRPHPKEGNARITILTPAGFLDHRTEIEALFDNQALDPLVGRLMRLQRRLLRVYSGSENPIESAMDDGDAQQVAELLEAGEDANAINSQGVPHLLAALASPEIVSALLNGGADPNRIISNKEEDWIDKSVIAYAAEAGLLESTRLLIGAGAKVDLAADNGATALYFCTALRQPETAALLIEHGANPNLTTDDGRFPLLEATLNDDLQMIRLLVAAGADVNQAGAAEQLSPFMVAAQQGELDTVIALTEAGAEIETRDADSYTALMNTCDRGRKEMVDALIRLGADVNATDKDGSTPLMFAAQHGHLETVQSLLDAGAEINARGSHNFTALSLVKQHGTKHQAMIDYLTSKGAEA